MNPISVKEYYRIYEPQENASCGICLSPLEGRVSVYHTGDGGHLHPTCLSCQTVWFSSLKTENFRCHLCHIPLDNEQITKMIEFRRLSLISHERTRKYLPIIIGSMILQSWFNEEKESPLTIIAESSLIGVIFTVCLVANELRIENRDLDSCVFFMGIIYTLYELSIQFDDLDFIASTLFSFEFLMIVKCILSQFEKTKKIQSIPYSELIKTLALWVKFSTGGIMGLRATLEAHNQHLNLSEGSYNLVISLFLGAITVEHITNLLKEKAVEIEESACDTGFIEKLAALSRALAQLDSPIKPT